MVIFSRHEVPETVISDKCTHFTSAEFLAFTVDYDFPITSSPCIRQSNGEQEMAIQSIKMLLLNNHDPYRALLAYRVTPLLHGPSAAEMLTGQK